MQYALHKPNTLPIFEGAIPYLSFESRGIKKNKLNTLALKLDDRLKYVYDILAKNEAGLSFDKLVELLNINSGELNGILVQLLLNGHILKNDKGKYTPMLWSKVFSEKGLEFLSILNQNLFGTGNVKKRWDKLERSLRHLGKSRNKNETLTLKFSEIQ